MEVGSFVEGVSSSRGLPVEVDSFVDEVGSSQGLHVGADSFVEEVGSSRSPPYNVVEGALAV